MEIDTVRNELLSYLDKEVDRIIAEHGADSEVTLGYIRCMARAERFFDRKARAACENEDDANSQSIVNLE